MSDHLDEDRVYALLQGSLAAEALAGAHAHIDSCRECRELLAAVGAVRSTMQVGTVPAPDTLAATLPDAPPMRVVIRDGKLSMRGGGAPASPHAPPSPAVPVAPARGGRAPRLELAPGMVIGERYRLQRRIGEGGAGVVWAATHTMMKREVALKFLKAGSPEAVKRFLREARVGAALRHPSIVDVHDVFMMPPTDTPVMVMDLLAGESLGARLARDGRIPPATASRLLVPVISALEAAHQLGVVHRDLKPENVFIVAEPGHEESVRVLDFGLAKLTASEGSMASTSRLTRSGTVLGTPYYMAPEQVVDGQPIGPAADVWALGVVLYEALSGARPFVARGLPQLFAQIGSAAPSPIGERVPGVPRPLAWLIDRMLSKSTSDRPALAEVRAVLLACADPR